MSYTPPPLNSIDLTNYASGYTPPALNSIDLTGSGGTPTDPEGAINAALDISASFSGYMQPTGEISAFLPISAEFTGGDSAWGSMDARLNFSANFSGATSETFGKINAALDFSFSGKGFQDWSAGVPANLLKPFFTLTITGTPDLVVPISSWQATLREGNRSDYLQAVIPGAADIAQAISDRAGGRLIIRKGYRFDDGSENSEIIAESEFSMVRVDRGPSSYTITASGYMPSKPAQSAVRSLTDIQSINISNGSYRVRSGIDLFLRPGMTALADNETFNVSYINFYVGQAGQFCEVGGE